jgi:hypothetical protein
MKSTFVGSSGLMKLDGDGERRDVSMDVLQLSAGNGLRVVGVWTTRDGLLRKEDSIVADGHGHDHVDNEPEAGHKSYHTKKTVVISSILVRVKAS